MARRIHMRARILTPAAVAAIILISLTAWPAHATQPALSINDVTVTEPKQYESGTATFTVSLDKASDEAVSVAYSTSGTGNRARATSGTTTLAAGDTSASIEVDIFHNSSTADWSFIMTLSNPVGATISDATGIATITNVTPTGTFLCQAFDRTPVPTLSAGAPDRCVTDDESVPFVRLDTHNDTLYQGWASVSMGQGLTTTICPGGGQFCGGGAGVTVVTSSVTSFASTSCPTSTEGRSYVGGVQVWTHPSTVPVVIEGGGDYKSVDVAGGYRIELNVGQHTTDADTTLLRQSAVRVTAPDGAVTSIGVAEAGTKGQACFS